MKKYFSMILVVVCMLIVVACGGKTDSGENESENKTNIFKEKAITIRNNTNAAQRANDNNLLEELEIFYFEDNCVSYEYRYFVYASEELAKEKYQSLADSDREVILEKGVVRVLDNEPSRKGYTYEELLAAFEEYGSRWVYDYMEEEFDPIENYDEILASHLEPLTERSQGTGYTVYTIYYFDETGHANEIEMYQVCDSEEFAKEKYEQYYADDANASVDGTIIHRHKHEYTKSKIEYMDLRHMIKSWNGKSSEMLDGVVTP